MVKLLSIKLLFLSRLLSVKHLSLAMCPVGLLSRNAYFYLLTCINPMLFLSSIQQTLIVYLSFSKCLVLPISIIPSHISNIINDFRIIIVNIIMIIMYCHLRTIFQWKLEEFIKGRNPSEFEKLLFLNVNILTKASTISHKLKSLKLFKISKL